jgi:hypothetical protein
LTAFPRSGSADRADALDATNLPLNWDLARSARLGVVGDEPQEAQLIAGEDAPVSEVRLRRWRHFAPAGGAHLMAAW